MAGGPARNETDAFGFPADPASAVEFAPALPARRARLTRVFGGAGRLLERSASYGLIVALVVLLVGAYFWQRIIYIVPSGHGGVL